MPRDNPRIDEYPGTERGTSVPRHRGGSSVTVSQVGGLAKLMDPLLGRMAAWYQKSVGTELRKYGLRYEDLLDPQLDLVGHTFNFYYL